MSHTTKLYVALGDVPIRIDLCEYAYSNEHRRETGGSGQESLKQDMTWNDTNCVFFVSSTSWKMTQPDFGLRVKRTEFGWTCSVCRRNLSVVDEVTRNRSRKEKIS